MLIDFRIDNFRSFAREQTLSMLASTRIGSDHPEHCLDHPEVDGSILRAGVIWGANGAGKSNLFLAMQRAVSLILEGLEPKQSIPWQPFLFDSSKQGTPTGFEFRFLMDDRVYSYGFTFTQHCFTEEWLLLHQGDKEEVLFERTTDPAERTTEIVQPGLGGSEYEKARAMATVGTRSNLLFLTALHDNIPDTDLGSLLAPVIDWFENHLVFIGPDDSFAALAELIVDDEDFVDFAGAFLSRADTGIRDLTVHTREIDATALSAQMGKDRFDDMVSTLGDGQHIEWESPDGVRIIIEKGSGVTVKIRKVMTRHENCDTGAATIDLSLSEESDGTKRLLNLLPALHQVQKANRVFIIDELDRSLHPKLTAEFIRCFLELCAGDCRQLIVTTHEDRLLDLNLLRRDEIWFVEKDQTGASELKSLADFSVRTDLKIDKGYLNGRFGGIPRLDGLRDHCRQHFASSGKDLVQSGNL